MSARFLEDLLTRAPWREAVPFAGVEIKGARIAGNVNLEDAKLIRPIKIANSRIEGEIDLRHARTDSLIRLNRSLMNGEFSADGMHSESSLFLRDSTVFKSDVRLVGAKIDGTVTLTGASFEGTLNADKLQVGESLLMRSDDTNMASFKDVDLSGAKIAGQIDMIGAFFGGTLDAESLQVGKDLLMRLVYCAQETNLSFAHVGGNLDLRGASLAGLDLSSASIVRDFRLGGSHTPTGWKGKNGEPKALNLSNAHIGNLADAKYAWPDQGHLHLNGFRFDHLGGFAGETEPEMRDRGMGWWDNWARLDPDYSPAPYAQLAAALTNAGDRDAADEIRYLGRVRERETENGWGSYIWSGALQYVAGFGIGAYKFRVLWWVLGISLLGALYLRTVVQWVRDENHGLIWCFGASLSRLLVGILPVVEMNKEFTEFFYDPERNRLTGLQSFIFLTMGYMGWLLSTIVIIAVSS
jgi:uncharacterized protein YjbI with pentapeptide repeats